MKRGPQVYDLPVANLQQHTGHYVPPRARDTKEETRRRNNPPNTLVLEAQQDGVKIMSRTFESVLDDAESHEYFVREMGAICLNTAWYSYANMQQGQTLSSEDQVGRRRLELPKHAVIEDDMSVQYETSETNHEKIREQLSHAAFLSHKLELAHAHRHEATAYRTRKQFGHIIGNLGLRLVATPLINRRDSSPYDTQIGVRDAGRSAIERSRQLHDGVYPTLAQLPDLNSQLSVHVRRTAPTIVHDSLIDATAQVAQQRSARYEY